MKPVRQYVVLVDSHRKSGLYRRQTAGRYRVAAKTKKEAEELVRKKIGFGSIHVYYEDKNPQVKLPHKTVCLEHGITEIIKAKHQTDPVKYRRTR